MAYALSYLQAWIILGVGKKSGCSISALSLPSSLCPSRGFWEQESPVCPWPQGLCPSCMESRKKSSPLPRQVKSWEQRDRCLFICTALWEMMGVLKSKRCVIMLYCLTPEGRVKEALGYTQQGSSYSLKWNIVPLVTKSPADTDFLSLLLQPRSTLLCFPEMLLRMLCFLMKHEASCALLPLWGLNVTPVAVPKAQCRVKSARWSPEDLLLELTVA